MRRLNHIKRNQYDSVSKANGINQKVKHSRTGKASMA